MQKNRSSKQTFMFFTIYFALLCCLIFAAVTLKPSFQQEAYRNFFCFFKRTPDSEAQTGNESS